MDYDLLTTCVYCYLIKCSCTGVTNTASVVCQINPSHLHIETLRINPETFINGLQSVKYIYLWPKMDSTLLTKMKMFWPIVKSLFIITTCLGVITWSGQAKDRIWTIQRHINVLYVKDLHHKVFTYLNYDRYKVIFRGGFEFAQSPVREKREN